MTVRPSDEETLNGYFLALQMIDQSQLCCACSRSNVITVSYSIPTQSQAKIHDCIANL